MSIDNSGNTTNPSIKINLPNLNLQNIKEVYETEQKEELRTDFANTFNAVDIETSPQGQAFLEGLINNKETIISSLEIDEEEYDMFACMALALASQETGMGKELTNEESQDSWKDKGYEEENTGWGKIANDAMKLFDTVVLKNGSSSSGLTQLKLMIL